MAQNSGNIDQIVEQIVCTVLLGDKDYQNIEDKAKRKMIYDQQTESVNDSINQMCAQIESNLPQGMSLPSGIRVEVANQLLTEVGHNPSAAINGFELDTKQIMKDFNLPVREYVNESGSEIDSAMGVATAGVLISAMAKEYGSGSEQEAQIINRAFSVGATEHDQHMLVALTQMNSTVAAIEAGLKFEDLDEKEQGFLILMIRTLKEDGKEEDAQQLMNGYGIDERTLKDSKFDNFTYFNNIQDPEDAAVTRKIEDFAGMLGILVNHKDAMTNEQRKVLFEKLTDMLDKSDVPIDSLAAALSRIEDIQDFDMPEIQELKERMAELLESPNSTLDIDEYFTRNIVVAVNKIAQEDKTTAGKIWGAFNTILKKNGIGEVEFDNVLQLDDTAVQNLQIYNKTAIAGIKGASNILSGIKEGRVPTPSVNTIELPKESNYLKASTQRKSLPAQESLKKSIINIWKNKGIDGVMQYMAVNCLENRSGNASRSLALEALESFFGEEYQSVDQQTRLDDAEKIKAKIKGIMDAKGDKLATDQIAYKYVQRMSSVVKSVSEIEHSTVLSANNVATEQIVEQFGDGNDRLVRSSQNNMGQDGKKTDDTNVKTIDGDEPEL